MLLDKGKSIISCICTICCLCIVNAYGQQPSHEIDSLSRLVNNSKTDTDKVNNLLLLCNAIKCKDATNKVNYATEALQLSAKAGWEKGIVNAYIAMGTISSSCKQNYAEAINYFHEADSFAEVSGDKKKQAYANFCIADNYKFLSRPAKALEYYRAVLTLKADPDLELNAMGNMGVIYQNVSDFPAALACYDSSLKELDQLIRASKNSGANDTIQLALLLTTIGEIYRSMHEFEKAHLNYNGALQMARQTGFKPLEIQALMGIAATYRNEDVYNKAIQNDSLALAVCKELGDKKNETLVQVELASVYNDKGRLTEALQYAQAALKQAEENNYQYLLPTIFTLLGDVYTSLKDYTQAVSYLNKAIGLSKQAGSLDVEKDALEHISKTYKLMNKPALALDAYQQFIAIRDSLYSIDKANELTRIDLQSGYDRSKVTDSVKQAGEYNLKMAKQRSYTIGGYAGLVAVLLLSFFIYRNYAQQKKAVAAITKANKIISEQKQVSETLLLNILPADVAEELKARGKVKARLYDHVTVLFTDFANFTAAGARLSPEALVDELQVCFEAFDNIIGKYKIEKIKTVGDAYVAASGLPNANPNHATDMVKAAIEIRDFVNERRKQLGDATFGIRIGINSGKLVAGIVGVKKFAYDIWGDTVNTAARMEQTGEEGKINISQATYDLVKDEINCTYRGEIDAKGKGKMKMYFAG